MQSIINKHVSNSNLIYLKNASPSHLPPNPISTIRVLENCQARGPSGLPAAPQPKGSSPQTDAAVRTVLESQKIERMDFPSPAARVSPWRPPPPPAQDVGGR